VEATTSGPHLRVKKGSIFMVRKIRTGDEGVVFEYFNETSVGEGGNNNKRTDNLLVQLFLREFYGAKPKLFAKLPKTKSVQQSGVILLDGIVGPQTKAGIRVFQEFVRTVVGRGDGFIDGRVSVPNGLFVPRSHSFFTMDQLNSFFFNARTFNMKFNDRLQDHPIVISLPELQAELSTRKVEDR
jgi:hypothetical protein